MNRIVPLAAAVLAMGLTSPAHSLVPVRTPNLVYPAGEVGVATVVVSIVVDESGHVVEATVVSRDPVTASEAFARAALEAARAFVFAPSPSEGRPPRASLPVTLRFEPPAASLPDPPSSSPSPSLPEAPAVSAAAVPDTVVRVRARRPDATVGEVHLHGALLQDVPHRSAAQMLTSAPGILLTNHGGEGHAPAVFLRGFDAGEGQDLEFRLDGVPLNDVSNPHSHGYADAHFIIPELVDELRVIEGPYDPRQGDFAVAGTAEYHLGLHDRGVKLLGAAGSYGTLRSLLLWGPEGESDGTFAAIDLRSSDGFGINRKSASASAMAQYETDLGPARVTLLGQSYAARFDSAGVLRDDDFIARRLPCPADTDSQFFCAYDPNQGGASGRHGFTLRLRRKLHGLVLEQSAFASMRRLRMRENFTGFLLDLSPGTQRGDNSEKVYGATTVGMKGSLKLLRELSGRRLEVEFGYLARHDTGDSLSRRLRASGGEAYKRDFDVGFDVTDLAVYANGELQPVPRLRLRGGVRAESFAFSVVDRNRPALDRDGVRETSDHRDAFGWALMPRAALQWKLTDGLDWMISAGSGARSSDASALSDGEFAPFHRVWSAETGLMHEVRGGKESSWTLSSRGSVFATRVDRALVFDEVAARNVLAGASNRYGALGLVRVGVGGWLDAQGSVTYAEAYRPPEGAPWWKLSAGDRMPYVPRWVSRLDASVRRKAVVHGAEIAWATGLGVTHIAPRPLPLGAFSDPILTIDATARVAWRALEIELSAQNLLDARYRLAEFNYASNFASADLAPSLRAARTFAAGAPRMVQIAVSVHFDGVRRAVQDHDQHDEELP